MKRIRNLLIYRADEKMPVFTNVNGGGNPGPIYADDLATTIEMKRNGGFRVLSAPGELIHGIVDQLRRPLPNRSRQNTEDIDFTITPL